ncbi:MAG TPA: dienelactone hydrolase family protein [Gemmatimonadales bacterium]|nr:dienelactone hydrolase family protein [Gemmatimonadales bacterium]
MTAPAPLEALIDSGSPTGPLIVLFHGRGSDERDLFPLGRMLHPDATVVSIRAPFLAAPWGYGPGYAWYRFMGGNSAEPESFRQGQEAVAAFLASLPARLGRPATPPILGGFSQGGTTALASLLRNPGSARGVIVFSGFLADDPSVRAAPDTVARTPIFWGHGTSDLAVPFMAAEAGWATLRAANANLEAHTYRGMAHTIGNEELADAQAWLEGVLQS